MIQVAGRELRENTRTKTFLIVTAVLALAALAAVIVPTFFDGDDSDPLRVAVADAPATLAPALERAGRAVGRPVRVLPGTAAAGRAAVDDGGADVAVVGPGADGAMGVVVREELGDQEQAVLLAAAGEAHLRSQSAGAGVSPADADRMLMPPRLDVTALDPDPAADEDLGIAFLALLVLVIALAASGAMVAAGVAEEKATRISEILLAAMRPGELIAGKVIGIGLLALGQLVVIIAPALVAAAVVDGIDLPDAAPGAALAVALWFPLGYAFYAVGYGALGALVSRQQEVGMAIAPLSYLLWGGYAVGALGVDSAGTAWFRLLSLLPPLSPMLMPVRMITGEAGAGDVILAVVLTALGAAALIWLGARVYRTGLVAGGPRVTLTGALRRALRGG